MTTTKEKASATEWLALNWPSFVAMAVIIILVTGLYIKGGHAPYGGLMSLITLSFPFSVFASTGFIWYMHIMRIMRKSKGWYGSIIFVIVFVIMAVVGLFIGEASMVYQFLTRIWQATPWYATMSANAFAVILLFARALKPKNNAFTFMIILTVIALLASSPLGENVFPPSYEWGMWIQNNLAVVGNNLIWLLIHLAEVGLIIRVFTLREKLRVGV